MRDGSAIRVHQHAANAQKNDRSRCMGRSRGALACVNPMPKQKRIPAFSPFLYRYCTLVECFLNDIKYSSAIATRDDKRDANSLASVQLASIRIWGRRRQAVF